MREARTSRPGDDDTGVAASSAHTSCHAPPLPPQQRQQQQALALALPPRHAPAMDDRTCAMLAVSRDLVPCVHAFAAAFAAPVMFVAAGAEPLAPIKTLDVTTLLSVRDFGRSMCAVQLGIAAQLRAASAALVAEGDGDKQAWRLGARAPLLAESSVHATLVLSHSLSASCNDIYGHLPSLLGRELSAPEAAHTAEHMQSCDAMMTFANRAGALLAQLRQGSGVAYLDGSAAVVEQVAAILDGAARASQGRLDKFAARLVREPHGWRHTFFKHAEANGVKSTPLVAAGGGSRF
jgi:hypothetical protein